MLGFKSFADKTVLNFDSGITCIVGPNGCGKSNIADAFRWVLGEQSAKSMRGNKMPDVIFSGTSHRKPLNFAEVSLTLSDVQGSLPIDYEEVTMTRRLHRSGESEYLLNNNPVRLKDLQLLLLGSGVGRNAFSIFEQGKLDQVISFTPHERRYIFEEAAGILRFLQRKKEALKKLEQADFNLSRIQDISLEVEKQIQTLEMQAKKAKIYKEKKRELEQLEKASYVLRWQSLEKKQTDLNSKLSKLQNGIEEQKSIEMTLQTKHQEVKLLCQRHERDLRAQSEQLLILKGKQELQGRESQTLQTQLKETQQREKKFKQELEDLFFERQTRQKKLIELGQQQKQLENEWGQAENSWVSQQERVKHFEKEVNRLRQELTLKQQAHLKMLQQNGQWQSELKQGEVRLQNFEDHQKTLNDRLKQLKIDSEQLIEIRRDKKQQLQQLSDLIDVHKDRLEALEEQIKSQAIDEENKKKEIENHRRKIMEIKARQKVLFRMRDEFEGFSSGSKKLLQESQNPNSPFYKKLRPLYEFFHPNDKTAEALAVLLRTYSQTLVVEEEKDLKELLIFTQNAHLQDFSLLCLEWMLQWGGSEKSPKSNFLVNTSAHSVEKHFLSSIAIASSHEEVLSALKNGEGDEGWSLQGFFLDHRGVLFQSKPGENQVFLRESELKSLEEELNEKEDLFSQLERALQSLQQNRSHLQLERMELDKQLRRDEMKLVEINFGLQRAIGDLEKNQSIRERGDQELVELKRNLEELSQAVHLLNQKSTQSRQELNQLHQEKDFIEQDLNKQEGVLRIQEQDQKNKGAYYQQVLENQQKMRHQFQLLEAKELDHDKNVQRIEEELNELEERIIQLKQKEKGVQELLISIETQIKENGKNYAELEKQGVGFIQLSELAEQELIKHLDACRQMEKEMGQIDIQLAHHRAVSQSVIEELSERYQLTMEQALQGNLPMDQSMDQAEKKMKSLRQSLQECGDVNLAAIEDLEKQQQRVGFLNQQIEDMRQSKEELLNLIQTLDGESQKLFIDTFKAIRTNFQKNFQILFNGGEADLHFTDSQNILEAGIEISAKPPGKQMRAISLLSGGEKCLTAVALLFAIFEVKPAPFCILDEIDAPLDDTNVQRFVNVVKHFADRCQFLIITHNKGTMSIGDVLFGVSMEEKGVSKLLSLEFATNEVPEASLIT